ncbi:MAG: hypothetical protein FJX74_22555, partial [Armatimonadetes bacterium]|nr:hypothetical protein [Armatimonadota bacterium]
MRRLGLLTGAAVLVVVLTGCARGPGGGGPVIPEWVLQFFVRFAGPVDDTSFYYIAIDADGDYGLDGPLPVAAGPFWGNGWGTGSITHFISYTQGRYDVYEVSRRLEIIAGGGAVVGVTGSPDETDTGEYRLTVGTVTLGAATVGGTGTVAGATNDSSQNAGEFSIETDAAGETVAGGVSFTPATDGGRALTSAEQTALDALNGGVALAADSLAPFGLTLQIGTLAAGTQTVTVAPTVAAVAVRFQPSSGSAARDSTGTLTANSDTPTATPPIPGASLRTEGLTQGAVATLRSETSPAATLLGPPYESVAPLGSSQLDVTIDLAMLGAPADDLSVNFISKTELIFDPTITDP